MVGATLQWLHHAIQQRLPISLEDPTLPALGAPAGTQTSRCELSSFRPLCARLTNALGGSAGPSGEASSSKTPILPPKPVGASSQGTSSKDSAQKKRSRSPGSSTEKRNRPVNASGAASNSNVAHSSTTAPSGSATPASSAPGTSETKPRNEAIVARPTKENPPLSKRSRSKSIGPSNKAKASATGAEQDAKARASARTGGGQLSKEKGKVALYHPRVDPYILQLVKCVLSDVVLVHAKPICCQGRLRTL